MKDLYKRLGMSMTEAAGSIRIVLQSFRDGEFRRDCERILLDPEAREVYDRNLRLLRQIAEVRKALGIEETAYWSRGMQRELETGSRVAQKRNLAISKSSLPEWTMWPICIAGIVILFLYFSRTVERDHSRFANVPAEVESILQYEEQNLQPSVSLTVPPNPETRLKVYDPPSPSVSNSTNLSFGIETLSASRLREERLKYDNVVHAGTSQGTNATDDAIHKINGSYIKLLESRQSKLPKSSGLYQAYTREIQLVRFYAFRPPYIVNNELISRENFADRLTPERNAYDKSVKSLPHSNRKLENQEEVAAVTLILATKTVIKEIQNRYFGADVDRNALVEEFRILREVIPKDSANFKTLTTQLQLVQNEMLK